MITGKKKIIKYLNVAAGQITGIKDGWRRCGLYKISNQIAASIAYSKSKFWIIHNHLHTCVKIVNWNDIDGKFKNLTIV